MPSLSSKDRVPLCRFTFDDGRRCRTPRVSTSPHFCFYHAQKEARAQAVDKLAKDLACFFSGDYLTACDLSTAMARLIPATIRGDIKPRLARTVAYMLQTQLQAIHLAQHEYVNAFGTDGWRKAIRTSVNANYDHRFPTILEPEGAAPPAQAPAQPTSPTSVEAGLARPEPSTPRANTQPATESNQPATQTPDPSAPPATQPTPPPRPPAQTRDPYAVHYGPNYRLIVDGKPF
jgi:hypothetical protein